MKKVSAWIPQETLTKLEEKGYQNRAEAIRLGLEGLLKESIKEDSGNPLDSKTEDKRNPMESTKEHIRNPIEDVKDPMKSNGIQYELLKARNEELERRSETERTYLKKDIERLTLAMQEAPDPVELAEVRAHFEGLQKLLEEKEERIKELNREVERLDVFAYYFKAVEVKQIEAPATENKKPWWRFW